MVKTPKQTPLTVESFEKIFMPVINKQFVELRNDITKVVHKVNQLDEKVDNITEKIKYLPTTEVYLTSQDKLMGELQKSTETTALTGQHYTDTNDRIDRIDKFIGFNSYLN